MREFNARARVILAIAEERNSNPDREVLVREESGNVKFSGREVIKEKNAAALDHRCELCDWSLNGSSLFRAALNLGNPSYVTYDKISSRYLCNICRGEANPNSAKKILESLEIALDTPDDMQEDIDLDSAKRAAKFFSHSYLDTVGDEGVEVKVYRPTDKRLKSTVTEEEKEKWREEYSKSLVG